MDVLSSGVQQSSGLWDEIVAESGGFSPDARQQQTEQFVAGVMGVFDNPEGLLPEPLGVQVLHGWQLRDIQEMLRRC